MRKLIFAGLIAALAVFANGCKRVGTGDEAEVPAPSSRADAGPDECEARMIYGDVGSAPAPPGEEPADGDMLVHRLSAEPGTLNPLIATDVYSQHINNLVFDSLISQDLATGELLPGLAESWEISDDKLTYTFHLRKGVTFHDGRPLTADDVIYTYDRILDPKVDAPVIRGFFADCEWYKKIDDHTVQVKWRRPYFKTLSTLGGVEILPKHLLDDGSDFNKHPFARRPVGSGPYRFVEWETGQRILLERNPDYWGEHYHFDRIFFKIITKEEVALRVLMNGDLDLIQGLRASQWVSRDTNSPEFLARFNKLQYDYPTFNYIGWNLRNPLFQDKRVRQALAMLLNREAIQKNIYYCLASISKGPFDPPYADPELQPWPYDPRRARALLAEAGWRDTTGDGILDKDGVPFRFELSITADVREYELIANIYQQDLRRAGIIMTIRKLEWSVFLENVKDWKFDACGLGWALVPNPDPYQIWHGSQAEIKGSSNHVGYQNPEVDRLIELNREEFDREKRIEYCQEIHRLIHEDQPYAFLMVRKELTVVDKRILNIEPHPIRPIFYLHEWFVPKRLQKHTR